MDQERTNRAYRSTSEYCRVVGTLLHVPRKCEMDKRCGGQCTCWRGPWWTVHMLRAAPLRGFRHVSGGWFTTLIVCGDSLAAEDGDFLLRTEGDGVLLSHRLDFLGALRPRVVLSVLHGGVVQQSEIAFPTGSCGTTNFFSGH